MAFLGQGGQQRGAVRATGDGDQDAIAVGDHIGAPEGKDQRVEIVTCFGGGHGGAGWTRTSDNAIMSRALYHLSYGTEAGERLTGRLRPCLALPLLYPVLRDRDALPLVQSSFLK